MSSIVKTANALDVRTNSGVGASTLPSRYSKFSTPRLSNPLARPALFDQLNKFVTARSTIWISAPPGAGKSTLLASFLAYAQLPAIWYTVDEGDNDPASFLAFLAKTVQTDSAEAIPTSANYLADLDRNFFDQFYARLPTGSMLVFDDVQHLDWNLAGAILESAIAAAPPEVPLCFISREAPPIKLDGQMFFRPLARIGWSALRLNETESLALAGRPSGEGNEKHRYWLDLTNGWAAGIVMLRDHLPAPDGSGATTFPPDALDTAFHYFAGEMLAALTELEQRVLLMLAHMSDWSRLEAVEVTGEISAAALLERLHECGLFVDGATSSVGNMERFHFHPLFQMFLEHESSRRFTPPAKAALNSRIAGAFLRRGQTREAAARYRDVEDWNALASLLSREARRMIAAGSGKSWLEWQHWLPEHVRDGHPWLWYWEGYYLNFFDSRQANLAILRAQTVFTSRGDLRASLLSISLLIDNFLPRYNAQDHTPLRHWIDLMGAQIAALPIEALSADDQLVIQSRLIAALVCTSVNDCVALHRAVDACMQAMAIAQDDEARLTAGTLLLAFAHGFRFDQAESMISIVEPLAEKVSIDATIRVWWHFQLCRWQFDLCGDLDRALQAMECATAVVSDYGLQAVFGFRLNVKRLLMLVSMANHQEARSLIGQMRTDFTPGRKVDEMRFRMVEALYHCGAGELALAVSIGTDVFRDESRIAISERPRFARVIAGLHALAGDFPEAEAWSARAIASSACTDLDVSIQSRELLRAYQRVKGGNRKGAGAILRKELLRHRAGSTQAFLPRLPQIASTIASFALEEGIETAHMSEIIRRQHLLPGDVATPDWPWTVTVQVLGPLRIGQGGITRKSTGKTQQRPLFLLKALLLAGASGRQQHALADQLWPDSDDAMTAMNTTLHRLRKLLGSDAAVTVTQGVVGLDRGIVWSDLDAFALILSRIDALSEMTPPSQILYLQNAICRLYRGPLCDGDSEAWIAGPRDRYRNHLVTAAAKLGARLEAMDAWSEAYRLYLVASEAESLAEVIHRGLMRCAQRLEGLHGADAAYRRCQETLSVVLGRKPSIETVKLAKVMGLCRESQ